MPSWQSILRIGCPINNSARRARGATPPTRIQWTRVPLDFRPRWRYVVDKAGAVNAAPALKYKFYFTPHFGGYTEFGIGPTGTDAATHTQLHFKLTRKMIKTKKQQLSLLL